MEIKFYENNLKNKNIKYVIIPCRYKGKWIFVRHNKRDTWEFPAGHIEAGETPESAAKRELYEETGALDFYLKPVSLYSVEKYGKLEYGYLFYADIFNLSTLPESEISEIVFEREMPDKLTYPYIQPRLFKKVLESIKKGDCRKG